MNFWYEAANVRFPLSSGVFPENCKMKYSHILLRKYVVWLCCVLNVLFTPLVLSKEVTEPEPESKRGITWQLDLGLAAQHRKGLINSLDRDDDNASLVALVSGGLYYDKFFVEGSPFGRHPLTLGYTLKQTDSTALNLIGLSWFPTISEDDQEQGTLLNGINKRLASFEVGVEYVKRFTQSDVRIRALHDGLGRHDGYLFSFDYGRPMFTEDWLIMPSWGFSYLSENAVDYYYGVRAGEATTARPEYKPGDAWGITARIYAERPMGRNWTLFGFASYSRFSDAVTDSPLVTAQDGTHNVTIGVLWSF